MKLDREILADIASVFQGFVDIRNIEIPNDGKTQALEDDPDNEGIQPTTIYGSDWDELLEGIGNVLEDYGIKTSEGFGCKDEDQDKENTIIGIHEDGYIRFVNIPEPLRIEVRDYSELAGETIGAHTDENRERYISTIHFPDGSAVSNSNGDDSEADTLQVGNIVEFTLEGEGEIPSQKILGEITKITLFENTWAFNILNRDGDEFTVAGDKLTFLRKEW